MRCDAGPATGVGHLVRCVALAEELVGRGLGVVFLGDLGGLPFAQRQLADRGLPLLPAPAAPEDLADLAVSLGLAAVVLDGYHLDPGCGAALTARGLPVLALSDGGFGADQRATIHLDQNLGAVRPASIAARCRDALGAPARAAARRGALAPPRRAASPRPEGRRRDVGARGVRRHRPLSRGAHPGATAALHRRAGPSARDRLHPCDDAGAGAARDRPGADTGRRTAGRRPPGPRPAVGPGHQRRGLVGLGAAVPGRADGAGLRLGQPGGRLPRGRRPRPGRGARAHRRPQGPRADPARRHGHAEDPGARHRRPRPADPAGARRGRRPRSRTGRRCALPPPRHLERKDRPCPAPASSSSPA